MDSAKASLRAPAYAGMTCLATSKEVNICSGTVFRGSGVPAAMIADRIAAGSRSNESTTSFRVCGHQWPEKAFYEFRKC